MARGWESKGVESQIEDRAEGRNNKSRNEGWAEDRERDQRRAGLEMSRRRIARELEQSKSQTHRAALENALKFLDDQIAKL